MSKDVDIFSIWNYDHGSGEGSNPVYSKDYIEFVSRFIRENGIKSVVDLGCGDLQVGSSIDYSGAYVIGVDASEVHIKNHAEKYKNDPTKGFIHGDVRKFDDSEFDLALVKDVLQHWPTEDILDWLARPHAKYVLLTNDSGGDENGDIPYIPTRNHQLQVAVRNLDLSKPPFSLEGEVVFQFREKKVFLLKRKEDAKAE